MTKLTKRHVRSGKTQISLVVHPVWSESSLSAWRKLGSLAQQRLWSDWALTLSWGNYFSICHSLQSARYEGIKMLGLFFLFLYENICYGYSLEVPREALWMKTHSICFLWAIRKYRYIMDEKSILSWAMDWKYTWHNQYFDITQKDAFCLAFDFKWMHFVLSGNILSVNICIFRFCV